MTDRFSRFLFVPHAVFSKKKQLADLHDRVTTCNEAYANQL
jgi:hypothetical protein